MVSSLMFSLVLSLGTSIVLADTSQVDRNPFYSLSHIPHRFISNLCGFLHFYVDFSIVLSIVLAIVPVYTALWWICNRHRG